ncbi:MAG: sugar ABC transporter substrate-binding protein [Thermomicrobiales bacterium]|nr:sugar ABC transporter substrate-binding protein [Thermomicrobiales bacterium]
MLATLPGGRLAGAQDTGYGGESVTLSYGLWDAAQKPGIDKQIAAFNQQFPNIKVEPTIVPFDDYWTKLQTGVAGGQTYDVFWMNAPNLPVFAAQSALLSIEPIVGDGGADPSKFPAALVESYTFDGTLYGIPRDFDTIALFYNTRLFDAAGVDYPTDAWGWEDLRVAAEKLTKDGGPWGFGCLISDQQNYFNFIKQNEGGLISDDFTTCLIDEPASCEALDYLTQFFTAGWTPSVSIMQANDPEQTLFPAGQIAMMPSGSWNARTFGEADPAIKVAPLPKGKQRACMIHGLANVIWAKSPNQGAALEWVKFLAGEEAERILGESATVIPAMQGLQEDWVASMPDLDLQVFLDAVEYSFPLPSPPSGPEWRDKIEAVLIEGWSGNFPAEELCTRAAAAANEALSS